MEDVTVWCLVVDNASEPVGSIFDVTVAPSLNISKLTKTILTDEHRPTELENWTAAQLFLWKPKDSLADDIDPINTIRAWRLNCHTRKEDHNKAIFLPPSTVGKQFSGSLFALCVVQLPPKRNDSTGSDAFDEIHGRGVKRRHDELDGFTIEKKRLSQIAKHAPSTSSFSKPSTFQTLAQQERVVACNRPFDFDTIPITLLQEEFGLFMDDCKAFPSPKSQELLQALTVAACNWYGDEMERKAQIRTVFEKITHLYLPDQIIKHTEYITDGNLTGDIIPAVESENGV